MVPFLVTLSAFLIGIGVGGALVRRSARPGAVGHLVGSSTPLIANPEHVYLVTYDPDIIASNIMDALEHEFMFLGVVALTIPAKPGTIGVIEMPRIDLMKIVDVTKDTVTVMTAP